MVGNVAFLLHAQRSSRIGEIQLQTVFYLGFSKRNITSVQAPILGKRILQVTSLIIYHIASQIWQLLQHGMGS